MGLSLAVGITEHMHRNISSAQDAALLLGQPLSRESELRKDLTNCPHVATQLPDGSTRAGDHWIIYIDDARQDEEFGPEEMKVQQGSLAPEFEHLLHFYRDNGMPGTVECQRACKTKSLGEIVDGRLGRRDLPPAYHSDVRDLVFWSGSQRELTQLQRQMVQGRVNRLPLQHRPLFSFPSAVWPDITCPRPRPFCLEALMEQVKLLCLGPLAHGHLRRPLEDRITLTDASETGGAVAYSVGLSDLGEQVAAAASQRIRPLSLDTLGVVAIGDSTGSLLRCLGLSGNSPSASLLLCSSKIGERVCRRSHISAEVAWTSSELAEVTTWLQRQREERPRLNTLVVHVQGEALEQSLEQL